MPKKTTINWVLWGGLAGMVIAPAVVLYLQRTRLSYALDQGEATITAAALQAGQLPSSHNVTVTGGFIDRRHVVLWRLMKKGSERERYYLLPVRPKGGAPSEPVKIIITSRVMPLQEGGDLRGLLRNLGGEGPSEAVKEKLRQQGVKVAADAVLIELDGSTKSEALWLALWVGLALFVPAMVAIPVWRFQRRAKHDAGAEKRFEALKAAPASGIEALEKKMFELAQPFLPVNKKSVMIRSSMLVGPLQAFVAVDGDERPAPPEIVDVFKQLYQTYKKAKAPAKMITYNFLYSEDRSAWRMTGGPM